MIRFLFLFLFLLFSFVWAKPNVVPRPPKSLKVLPTNEGAQVQWELNLPDTVLCFNNGQAFGIWAPHLKQALGCVFDLSQFPDATLEQIDFLHYSRQEMHGPYYYRIWVFDMDSSKLYYSIDSLQAGDSYDVPRFEIGVHLGSKAARPHVGIFIEGLSSPDETNSFPALMTDSSDYVPGVSYYLTDVTDPFLKSDPNFTNFYELKDVAQGATNLVLDLWINTNEGKITRAPQLHNSPIIRAPQFSDSSIYAGAFDDPAVEPLQSNQNNSIMDGFYIYRGDTASGEWEMISEVGAEERQYLDSSPFADSSYFYAVSSFNDWAISEKKITAYFQPKILDIKQARIDADSDFNADLIGKTVALRGTVVSPNFSSKVQIFINDSQAGIQLYSSKFSLNLNVGDSLFVYGKIDQYKGLTELVLDSLAQIQVLGQNERPPVPISLQEVNETNEGRLVYIENLLLVNPEDWPAEGSNGYSLQVTDGQDSVKLFIDKDTDLDGWTPPTGTFHLIAIVDQYTSNTPANDGYELRPRSQQDFIPATNVEDIPQIAGQFELKACYPNPFNPQTTIEYYLPANTDVKISIFNINGKLIKTLLAETQPSGVHRILFNGSNLSSGIYLISVKAGHLKKVQKAILIK